MNKILTTISAVALFFLGLTNANAGSLTVYTAIEAEDLKRYAATFNEDHPDIEINWVRDSTGIVTAKLLA
ncbi:MAG: putative 2-aminoethylphosphonate ABC transporter substrate-binding protein, partial [Pelagibacteraceae bacterium]|nr:putative 2-aminoethylphosphonate ABC transporter substrate-binding protein [Pelagibacteraceae bacterium]